LNAPLLFLFVATTLLATATIWLVAACTYRSFVAARYWGVANAVAAAGALMGVVRDAFDPVVAITVANGLLMLGQALGWAGIRRFQGRPAPWRRIVALVSVFVVLLAVFTLWIDDITVRIVLFSIATVLVIGQSGLDLLDRRYGPITAGALLSAIASLAFAATHVGRAALTVLEVGGPTSLYDSGTVQGLLLLATIFGSQLWNGGFLLIAIDRLRADVAALAVVDELTGAYNRRHFIERLDQECAHARRIGSTFSVLAFDLDQFKEINDGHGHAAGDLCLRRFTELVQARLGDGDVLARLGGDEFVVLLVDTTAGQAMRIAATILGDLRAAPVVWNGAELRISASAGAVEWSPALTPDEIVAQADAALYLSKQGGRDRVSRG